jgi:hypothetical protein
MYFLLPTDAEYIPHEIPLLEDSENDDDDSSGDDEENIKSMVAKKNNKNKKPSSRPKGSKNLDATSSPTATPTKKKTAAAAASGTATTTGNSSNKKRPVPVPKIASSAIPNKKSKKKKSMTTAAADSSTATATATATTTTTQPTSTTTSAGSTIKERNNTLTKEMEALPVKSLLKIMDDAVSKGLWERKHQIIGSTLCYHAVRSAGSSKEIQQEILDNNTTTTTTTTGNNNKDKGPGVSRTTIMEWIENSKQYKIWVQQMLSNMEPRSYQASITKSLLKAGFSRTSGAGRYM